MLKTFSKNLSNKGFFDCEIREGIQSSFRFQKDDKTLTVLVAGDEALLSSSIQPGKIWTIKSPKLEQILCHLVVSHFGKPLTSKFRGVDYESDTLVPVRSYHGAVVYKDCTGKEWIDSACTESNSLAIYDAFAKQNGESIALMLPWFFPMEDKEVKVSIDSNINLDYVSDYQEYLGYPIESCAPKTGVLVGDQILSSTDAPILYRINAAVKGFFSGKVPAPRYQDFDSSVDSAVVKLDSNNHIIVDTKRTTKSGLLVDSIESNLDLASIIPLAQSWGFGMNELRNGVSIDSSVVGYTDFMEIVSSAGGNSISCEPAEHKVFASVETDISRVNQILSAWGLDNQPGYFDCIQHVEVIFG